MSGRLDGMPFTRRVRSMTVDDIRAIERLFFRVTGRTPTSDFAAYFRSVFFDNPLGPEGGVGLVHEDENGNIDSAVCVLPMRMGAFDREMIGRMVCGYIADPDAKGNGAAHLALSMRPRTQDFSFADSGAAISADHCRAVGGIVLPIQSLKWQLVLRPAAWVAERLTRRAPGPLCKIATHMMAPADLAYRRVAHRWQGQPSSASDRALDKAEFIELVPPMLARFAVRPAWKPEELGWMIDMAGQCRSRGPLTMRAVHERSGRTIGCFLYYGKHGRPADVLNIFTASGCDIAVVAQMLAHLDRVGCTSASGIAQPFLMNAFCRHRGICFRPRGYFLIGTRHTDVIDAALKGDIYTGGLAGESWIRW